ncbi:MAG: hypothetical protein ABIL25_07910 [candidate division WOR-3 bacterium]
MSEYQKRQDDARRRQERKEQRAMRQLRHKLRQDSASLLDKEALEGAQEKIQNTLDGEQETFVERAKYERVSE